MMRIQRYFGLLLVASIMCFVYMTLNSRLVETEFFTNPSVFLGRYSREVSGALSFYDTDADNADKTEGSSSDVLPRAMTPDEQTLLDIQNLINKLLYNLNISNGSIEDEGDSSVNILNTETSSGGVGDEANDGSCEPQENIVFLKTHKTASSTLTNIFNRFGDLRDLKVALPLPGFNRFVWPRYFQWTSVDMYRLDGEYANVLCNHARYYRPALEQIMELGTKYVTILREPVSQFESTFDYMELSTFLGLANVSNAMEIFLGQPYEFLLNVSRRSPGGFPDSLNLARNGMFFDLGLSPRLYDNNTEVKKAIRKLDAEFSVVLIMEYFDESLVLLKREFCWDFEDIVYAKFNQRHGERRKKETITPTLRKMIKKWNLADVMLYHHFNRTFWKKIKKHGAEFYKDLREFRRKNAELQRECISPVEVREQALGLTKHVRGLLLNPLVARFNRYFCQKILTNEVEYIKYFRVKLSPHLGYQRELQREKYNSDIARGKKKLAGHAGLINNIYPIRGTRTQVNPIRDTRTPGNSIRDTRTQGNPIRDTRTQGNPIRDTRTQGGWRRSGVQFVDIPPVHKYSSQMRYRNNQRSAGSTKRKRNPMSWG